MSVIGLPHDSADDTPNAPDSEQSNAKCPGPGRERWVHVARPDEVSGSGPFALAAAGVDLVAVRTAGGLRAFEGRCPHQGALLGEGELDRGEIVCRNHGWRFDAETGERRGETQRLRACPVAVRGGHVYADSHGLKRHNSGTRPMSRGIDALPGPRGLPLVGNAHQLDASQLHEILERWAATFGPVYRLRLWSRDVVVVSDPDLAHDILLDRPETYRRVSNTDLIAREIGVPGIFSAEGDEWRPLRRLTMDSLSYHNVRAFYPTLRATADRLRERWDRAAAANLVIDLADDLRRFAADVTMQIVFGHDARTLEGDGDPIRKKLEFVFPFVARRMKAVVPYWRVVRLPADRRLDRAMDDIKVWLSRLVDAMRLRLATSTGADSRPSNLLEAMLLARDEAGAPLSDHTILGNLMQVLLAGEDTTANTLAWAVHELCDNARAVDALSIEADRVLGAATVAASGETADRLAYAGAVAQETMRLRPVVPILFAETNVDTLLGDLRMPRGTVVWLLSRPAGTDKKAFAQPLEFRPERWMASDRGSSHPTAHRPFGSGPRACPGRSLALVEMRVVLAMLYHNFLVERVGPREAVKERFAFALHPQGLRVRLRRRAPPAAGVSSLPRSEAADE